VSRATADAVPPKKGGDDGASRSRPPRQLPVSVLDVLGVVGFSASVTHTNSEERRRPGSATGEGDGHCAAVRVTPASRVMVLDRTVAPSTGTGPVQRMPSHLRGLLPPVVVIGSYLLIGFIAFWPILHGLSQQYFATEPDYDQAVWYLAWIPHALAHGLNPFFSEAILAPQGANLSANTAAPLLGLLTARQRRRSSCCAGGRYGCLRLRSEASSMGSRPICWVKASPTPS